MARSAVALVGALVALFASFMSLLLILFAAPGGFLLTFLLTLTCGATVVASLGLVAWIVTARPIPPVSQLSALDQYRIAVEVAWADRELSVVERDYLDALESKFNLREYQAADIERGVMGGKTKGEIELRKDKPAERVLYRVDPEAHYRVAVEMAWTDGKLNEDEKEQLGEVERNLKVAGGRAEQIEREIMGGTREELVSRDDDEDEREKYPPADERWLDLVEECVGVVKDLDRHMDSFDPARQELADHVILSLAEGLERTGVDLILDDQVFDSKRHESAEAQARTASGAAITETVSPGLAVGRRVLRKAQVRTE